MILSYEANPDQMEFSEGKGLRCALAMHLIATSPIYQIYRELDRKWVGARDQVFETAMRAAKDIYHADTADQSRADFIRLATVLCGCC
jgi:hypothetical protein